MIKPTKERAEAIEKLQPYKIQILSRDKIDTARYDHCVANSINETPLAYSWVLDHLNPQWEGVIINNYEGVMPIPISRKGWLEFIQMPLEVLNLGLFSAKNSLILLSPYIFHYRVFKRFKYINYSFMPKELSSPPPKKTLACSRKTYELNLNKDYTTLKNNYTKSHLKNIRRFNRNNLKINPAAPQTYKLLQQEKARKKPVLFTPHDYNIRFSEMINIALKNETGENHEITYQGESIGSAFFLNGFKRTVVFHIANEKGKKLKTTFGLIDHFIQQHAGEKRILDFAGSNISSIAEFNRGFGSIEMIYPNITINNLPWPINLIKEKNLLFKFKRSFLR